jgi:hypothetical protein
MWKQKLKLLRMPGPQGPEVNETITGEKDSVISKVDSPAIQITEPAPAKNNIIDDTQGGRRTAANDPRTFDNTRAATVGNNGAGSSSANTSDSLRNRSRKSAADSRKNTTTTSNQAPTVVGFRYYRDLGQK